MAIDKDGDAGVISQAAGSALFNPPPVRLRVSRPTSDPSVGKHLLVVPYKYGMAIEYDGVLECWVQDFSVHNNSTQGPGGGARFWVGNHDDTGGLRITAFNHLGQKYSELASQLFTGNSGGDMRFLVRDSTDSFDFRSGSSSNEQTHLRITADGQFRARLGEPEQVYIGAAGPAKEAGIAFGPDEDVRVYRESASRLRTDAHFVAGRGLGVGGEHAGIAFGPDEDVRVYRESASRLRTNARLVAGGGLGVGGAIPTKKVGRVASKLEIFDTHGKSLGFLAIHAKR